VVIFFSPIAEGIAGSASGARLAIPIIKVVLAFAATVAEATIG